MAVGERLLVVALIGELDALLELFHQRLDSTRVDAELAVEYCVRVVGGKVYDRIGGVLNGLNDGVCGGGECVDCVVFDYLQRLLKHLHNHLQVRGAFFMRYLLNKHKFLFDFISFK